jgi:hypothetical protein
LLIRLFFFFINIKYEPKDWTYFHRQKDDVEKLPVSRRNLVMRPEFQERYAFLEWEREMLAQVLLFITCFI